LLHIIRYHEIGPSDNILDIIICLYPPIYHTFSEAPPPQEEEEEEDKDEDDDDNHHPLPQYVVPAHL